MNRPLRGSPVDPPFACSGPRLVGEVTDTIVGRLADRFEEPRQPRFYAEGRFVVTTHTQRRVTPPVARQALWYDVESVLATSLDDLVEGDLLRINDLVRAIRAAERNDPLPPASIARVAA